MLNPQPLIPNTTLCSDPYVFSYHELDDSQFGLAVGVWSIYCHVGNLKVGEHALSSGDVAHGSGKVNLRGTAHFFILQQPQGEQTIQWTEVQNAEKTYTVTKPWGKEIWLTGRDRRDYCLKRIHITAGHQTSLQYHREKFETNVLVHGHIELIGDNAYNEFVSAPAYVNVAPPTVHRIRALSDIILVEASTAHLDDVVRLQDDANRPNGRIEAEHRQ